MIMTVHNPLRIKRITTSKVDICYLKSIYQTHMTYCMWNSVTKGGGGTHTLSLFHNMANIKSTKFLFKQRKEMDTLGKYIPNDIYTHALQKLHYEWLTIIWTHHMFSIIIYLDTSKDHTR